MYLDNSATTAVSEEVLKEMEPYFREAYGNPSTLYSVGREAKKGLDEARQRVADAINADSKEIIFTSGGSESDNLAIKGIALKLRGKGNHIITSEIEHPAVKETLHFLETLDFKVTYLPVYENGIVKVEDVKDAITPETILITIMHGNNEIGTLQPIAEIGKLAREHKILFHTDAVQTFGKVKVDVEELNVDLLSLSSHKIHGPKGVGALYVRKGIKFQKLINGGHQEKNKRAGTENVPAIVGMGKAIEMAYENLEEHRKKIKDLRDYYISEVEKRIPYIKINGDLEKRLPGNANISFRFIEGEGMLLNLDLKGICASSGSACTSGSLDPSHVLLAIGLPHEIAHGSLRISIGKDNTKEEVDYLLDNLEQIVKRLRDMSPLYEEFLEKEEK